MPSTRTGFHREGQPCLSSKKDQSADSAPSVKKSLYAQHTYWVPNRKRRHIYTCRYLSVYVRMQISISDYMRVRISTFIYIYICVPVFLLIADLCVPIYLYIHILVYTNIAKRDIRRHQNRFGMDFGVIFNRFNVLVEEISHTRKHKHRHSTNSDFSYSFRAYQCCLTNANTNTHTHTQTLTTFTGLKRRKHVSIPA